MGQQVEQQGALSGVRGMLVAAGMGTRLAPLTDWLPKPAVPVGLRPVAAYMLAHLRSHGLRELTVNLHHLAPALRQALQPYGQREGVDLHFVEEPSLLGTGGGIRNALDGVADDELVVIANGKLLFMPDLAAALQQHRRLGAVATMVLKPLPPASRFSPIHVDDEGFVRRMLDRSPEASAGGLKPMMFTGVQILAGSLLRRLPAEGCLVRDGYLHWLQEGLPVAYWSDTAPFWDVGVDLAAYHAANMAVRSGAFPVQGQALDAAGNLVAEGVEIPASAELQNCIVGANVRVAPGARGQDLVIWPGTAVSGQWERAVLTPTAAVPVPG